MDYYPLPTLTCLSPLSFGHLLMNAEKGTHSDIYHPFPHLWLRGGPLLEANNNAGVCMAGAHAGAPLRSGESPLRRLSVGTARCGCPHWNTPRHYAISYGKSPHPMKIGRYEIQNPITQFAELIGQHFNWLYIDGDGHSRAVSLREIAVFRRDAIYDVHQPTPSVASATSPPNMGEKKVPSPFLPIYGEMSEGQRGRRVREGSA